LPRTVQRNGIRLPPGLGGGLYRGEATGSIIGRDVLDDNHYRSRAKEPSACGEGRSGARFL
jgi:hypothetical protein